MSGESAYADWIAVDWGTSRLRAWAMRDGAPKAEASSDDGMATLEPDGFEPALLRLVEPWLGAEPMGVVACGMVGARQGWIDAGYVAVPAPPLPGRLVRAPVRDPRLRVGIVPGLSQETPADVMRGEETQIAGFLARNPDFDGILCLPGTHTKWAQISAREVVSFRTFMTGELYATISRHTILRHSLGEPTDDQAFLEALPDAISRPEALASRLFGLRAENLLHGLGPEAAASRLSGLLIGTELAAARPYWLGQEVALIGTEALSARYAEALASQGLTARSFAADEMTLAGLAAVRPPD